VRGVRLAVAALVGGVTFAACSSPSSAMSGTGRAKTVSAPKNPQPKAEVVDGVPLVPITAAQRRECQKFADLLKERVPCPELLPKPIPVPSTYSGPPCLGVAGELACGPAVIQVYRSVRSFFVSQSNFQVPSNYVGVTFQQYSGTIVPEPSVIGGPLGHFVFTAGKGAFQINQVPPYCSPVQVASTVRVHGSVATLYQCESPGSSPGVNQLIQGHDLLVWHSGGITAEVSFHGHSQVNLDLDIAVADATKLVSPKKS
jgi:hypothetical protein